MNPLADFILTHASELSALFVGIVVGGVLGGMIAAAITSAKVASASRARAREEQALLQTELYAAKQETAVAQSELAHTQKSMQEKTQLLQNSLQDTRRQLGSEFENLANRIFDEKQKRFNEQNEKTLSYSLDPLKTQITEFKQQVTHAYEKENAERNKLIGKIGELQQQTQKIGEDAVNLALALKGDNKSQGNWGEVILERLLEESGLQKGREYDTQVALKDEEGSRRNPDVIIYLPENKQLVIDSKVSLVHYERYASSEDETEKAIALKSHVDSVRQHIKGLSRKNYESLKGIQTLDFVFIFMPIEAAFMLALQHEPALFREAYDKQIVLVSPTTLMATLRTVSNLWRYHKQHKNAELIATQAGGLYDQFALVLESLDDLGNQLDKTQKSYQKTRDRLSNGRGNLIGRIEKLKKLGAKAKKTLPEAHTDDALLGDDREE